MVYNSPPLKSSQKRLKVKCVWSDFISTKRQPSHKRLRINCRLYEERQSWYISSLKKWATILLKPRGSVNWEDQSKSYGKVTASLRFRWHLKDLLWVNDVLGTSVTGVCFNKGRQCVNSQTQTHTCAPDEVRSGCVPISLLFSGFSFSLWELLDRNTSVRLESFKLSLKPVFLNAAFSRSEVISHRDSSLS